MQKSENTGHQKYPDWYTNETINETALCDAFLKEHPMKCIQ